MPHLESKLMAMSIYSINGLCTSIVDVYKLKILLGNVISGARNFVHGRFNLKQLRSVQAGNSLAFSESRVEEKKDLVRRHKQRG